MSAGVADETQIHTHMCYCEFNDIMPSIAALDADVISIETSRSDMELLKSFDFVYPNEIGPGVYDVHSPRCPSTEDMAKLLGKAKSRLAPDQIWVNPIAASRRAAGKRSGPHSRTWSKQPSNCEPQLDGEHRRRWLSRRAVSEVRCEQRRPPRTATSVPSRRSAEGRHHAS